MTTTLIPQEIAVEYAHRAVRQLAALWNDKRSNHSGVRAAFRRWRPGPNAEPDMEMRSLVWGYLNPPSSDAKAPDAPLTDDVAGEIVARAAVIVAARASAGEHEAAPIPFGAALQAAEIGDLRFMRLMTTQRSLRVDGLLRAMSRIGRKGLCIAWDFKMTRHVYNYLFGTEEASQRSVNAWAQEYFKARSRMDAGDQPPASPDSAQS